MLITTPLKSVYLKIQKEKHLLLKEIAIQLRTTTFITLTEASELQGLMVSIYITGTSNTFHQNTIHTTGASATVLPGRMSTFSYNKVTNTGLLQSDGAVFQGTKTMLRDRWYITILFMILKNMHFVMMHRW